MIYFIEYNRRICQRNPEKIKSGKEIKYLENLHSEGQRRVWSFALQPCSFLSFIGHHSFSFGGNLSRRAHKRRRHRRDWSSRNKSTIWALASTTTTSIVPSFWRDSFYWVSPMLSKFFP
jgi:hypothetical protein